MRKLLVLAVPLVLLAAVGITQAASSSSFASTPVCDLTTSKTKPYQRVVATSAKALKGYLAKAADIVPAPHSCPQTVLAPTAGGTALITGLLRQKWVDAFAWEKKHHATADRLSAALDHVGIGIVLLDSDTRAEFINRAFRDYFGLSDEQADSKPPFIALMYHGRDTGAWQLPEDELNAFIAKRTEMIRTGDSTPLNINLADGQVLRFSCTALPDGGRMLSYTPVTDLVRHTDDPGSDDIIARCAAAIIAVWRGTWALPSRSG